MKTVTIQIGNSDDKLTQKEYSRYIEIVSEHIKKWEKTRHFFGFSSPDAEWQNTCWVIEIPDLSLKFLLKELKDSKWSFKQDSIAVSVSDKTDFI